MDRKPANSLLLIFLPVMVILLTACVGSKDLAAGKQDAAYAAVYREIMSNDSILFVLGYNRCDTSHVRPLLDDSFEFYHDQAGLISSGSDFLIALANLCNLDYHATREPDNKKTEIHLMKKNNELYGVLQTGYHSFYAEKPGQSRYLTGNARFYHLWIKVGDGFKLRRVISFDHK